MTLAVKGPDLHHVQGHYCSAASIQARSWRRPNPTIVRESRQGGTFSHSRERGGWGSEMEVEPSPRPIRYTAGSRPPEPVTPDRGASAAGSGERHRPEGRKVRRLRLGGRYLLSYAAWKRHCTIHPIDDALLARHAVDLRGASHTKGGLHFTHGRPLPCRLVEDLVRARVATVLAGGR